MPPLDRLLLSQLRERSGFFCFVLEFCLSPQNWFTHPKLCFVVVVLFVQRRPASEDSSASLAAFLCQEFRTTADLKKAYHQASLKVHPDKGGSEEGFKQLSKAYENGLKHFEKSKAPFQVFFCVFCF